MSPQNFSPTGPVPPSCEAPGTGTPVSIVPASFLVIIGLAICEAFSSHLSSFWPSSAGTHSTFSRFPCVQSALHMQ